MTSSATDTAAPTEADLAIADELGMALVRLNRVQACIAGHASRNGGIDKSSFVLLATLVGQGPTRSSALAEAVHSDPSTISRQVAQLVKDGLVERRADPVDGRATLLAATDAGLELLRVHRRRRNEAIAGMVADWSAADRRLFAELLGRFASDYEEYMPIAIAELSRQGSSEEGNH
ncbi:MarR family winged helix-turn-helix transcriptional regulator [Allokutzneria albata]|uniref:DNA-binding transcriptional regulator, MarR family n=1 Tax=Allokutzneria albata TaxID=211114 RepID=A0A1H0AKD4_ALLAB|nr:MarR family transcriptional regulator [Allokutzneria albata]SDN33899.1 DNA-binding transcriptional regulator, MarR family [Allokutzneria albata]